MSNVSGPPVARRAGARRVAAVMSCLVALTSAGCGGDGDSGGGGGRVIGNTVTVVSLLPLNGPEAPVARDLLRGEKLALAEANGRAGAYQVTLSTLDAGDGGSDGVRRQAADAARRALSDRQAIAVIGSLRYESAAVTVPLLNAAGLLHVSPTAGYRGFVAELHPSEPERWYPSGRRTFAPAAHDDGELARMMVRAIREESGVARPRIAVEIEGGPEDVALARAVADAARSESARVVERSSDADALVYAGDDPVAAAEAAEDLARSNPEALAVFGDDLARTGLEKGLPEAAASRALFVSRAPEPNSTPELRAFHARYVERFGRAPEPYAALGYAVMRSVLMDGIAAAGTRASERGEVIDAYIPSARALPEPSAYRLEDGRRSYLDSPVAAAG